MRFYSEHHIARNLAKAFSAAPPTDLTGSLHLRFLANDQGFDSAEKTVDSQRIAPGETGLRSGGAAWEEQVMGNHVLLVEDELNILEAIRFLLSRDGWRVDTHSNGTDAAEVVRSLKPDLVVLDVMLPGKSGFDILEELRGHDETADLPILMLTARGQSRDREMAEKAGVSRFMTKPFSNTEVLTAVRDLVYVHRHPV